MKNWSLFHHFTYLIKRWLCATCIFFLSLVCFFLIKDDWNSFTFSLLFLLKQKDKKESFLQMQTFRLNSIAKTLEWTLTLDQILMTSPECVFAQKNLRFWLISNKDRLQQWGNNENVWSDKASPTKCIF